VELLKGKKRKRKSPGPGELSYLRRTPKEKKPINASRTKKLTAPGQSRKIEKKRGLSLPPGAREKKERGLLREMKDDQKGQRGVP